MPFIAAPRSLVPTAYAPYAALLAAIVSFAVGTAVAKHLFPLVGAEAASAYRVGLAALLLLALFKPWRLSLTSGDLLRVVLYGGALGLMNLCFYLALRSIPLGLAIAIEFMGPLALSLCLARRPAHFAAIALAAAGLCLLLPVGGADRLDPVGVAFALAAGVFWALYIVFGRRAGHLPGGPAVALGMTVAAFVVVPPGLHAAGLAMFTPTAIALGLVVAVLSSALPYTLEMVALKRVPARNFGVLLSIEPAMGALAGMLLLGEMLHPEQWAAIGLVVAASGLSVSAATGKPAPPVQLAPAQPEESLAAG